MSSKEEIRAAFINELKLTSEYQETMLLKQALLDEIAAPNVNHQINYQFTQEMTDQQVQTFSICFKLEFGWMPEFLTNTGITVSMVKFIE